MSDKISAKIEVGAIDKQYLFEGKGGKRYLDIILLPSTNSKFGDDFMIVQAIPKALRDSGQRGPILGNAKFFGAQKQAAPPPSRPPREPEDDSIPF
jgi:hypothetical protein